MTRICITGGSGYLGSHIYPGLLELGHDIVCVDMIPPEKQYGEFRQADLTSLDETQQAIKDAELVIHCASIHPWKKYSEQQYLDCNVKGTWNVFQGALTNGIERIILTSSIAASGYNPPPDLCPVGESYQQQALGDIYSITKQFQEQIARHFCEYKGMKIIVLRPPNFTPKSPLETGASLLTGCLTVTDIASAHVKSVNIWDKMQNSFEPFFITPTFPYSPQEIEQLPGESKSILNGQFPGAWDWFEERGMRLSLVPTHYDSSKAKSILGWQPEYTFAQWWAEESKKL